MSKKFIFSFFLILFISIAAGRVAVADANSLSLPSAETARKAKETYGKLPLYFIENNGQVDKKVRFYEKGSGHSTFFTPGGVYINLFTSQKSKVKSKMVMEIKSGDLDQEDNSKALRSEIIKIIPLNANETPEIIAEGKQEGKVNYFIGSDKSKWMTNVSTYSAVLYKEVYKGIDIKYYGNNQQLEYNVIVKPEADPNKVKFSYEGIEGLKVTEEGNLEIRLHSPPPPLTKEVRGVVGKGAKIIQKKPYIYQEIDGKRIEVAGEFKVFNSSLTTDLLPIYSYGFKVASYNKNHNLIIDPILSYDTYLGGSGGDESSGITVDILGNAYIIGSTLSAIFPLANSKDGKLNQLYDVFVTKIDPSGSKLIYSAYLGGSGGDYGSGIAVNTSGNAYITGWTLSADFPLAYPIDEIFEKGEAFVTRIDPSGSILVFSTYLGGSDADYGYDIAVDRAGTAYITGTTWSPDFQLIYPIDGTFGGNSEAFVTRINSSGSGITNSTFLGGRGDDSGFGIAVDISGNVYVTGNTESSDFPLANPIDESLGGFSDAFVTKINQSASRFIYSTYLGGSVDNYGFAGIDSGLSIAADISGNAYVTGYTSSSDFPLAKPIDGTLGGDWDAFVTKINPSGSEFIYSTYLGGSSDDSGFGIAVDISGNACVTGNTSSSDFPLASPIDETLGGNWDAFVAKITPYGANLVYSTYLGGYSDDFGFDIAVDVLTNVYITGRTVSYDFLLANSIDAPLGGYDDVFVAKIIGKYLTVNKIGTGSGKVISSPAGVDCGIDCLEPYYIPGTVITLTATPDAGSTFTGWSGDADCFDGIVIMGADKTTTCTAAFTLK